MLYPTPKQTQNICNIKFIQCWANVEDVGPTLCKCYTNVLSLVGLTHINRVISCYAFDAEGRSPDGGGRQKASAD